MARRADPERISEARRAALRNRLVDEDRLPPELADLWTLGWMTEAGDQGRDRLSASFWDGAREWILEQRGAKQRP